MSRRYSATLRVQQATVPGKIKNLRGDKLAQGSLEVDYPNG